MDCDHIGILTEDAERLIGFYCDLLSYRPVRDEIVDAGIMKAVFAVDADCRLVKLSAPEKSGGVNIEIFSLCDGETNRRLPRTPGYNHWGLRVGDRAVFAAELRGRGIDVTKVRRDGHPVFFISDPDGNRIEIRD